MAGWLALVLIAGSVAGAPGFLKGQLHLHTSNSGDSATPPADVVRWYAAHGYDFIVVTDHNRVTVERSPPSMLVIPGVELTQNVERCVPAAARRPRAACCTSTRCSSRRRADGKIPWRPASGASRFEIYHRALDASRQLGGLAQLNHPNFHYAADAPLIALLARDGLALLEIANRSWDSNDVPADKGLPTSEAIWDAVLTAGGDVFGTATDDAHHYFDARAVGARGDARLPGRPRLRHGPRRRRSRRRSARRSPAVTSTRRPACCSRGVERTGDRLEIDVDERSPGAHRFTFIGAGGRALSRAQGRRAAFALAGARGGYVRAVVEDGAGRRAWTQPIRVPSAPGSRR